MDKKKPQKTKKAEEMWCELTLGKISKITWSRTRRFGVWTVKVLCEVVIFTLRTAGNDYFLLIIYPTINGVFH